MRATRSAALYLLVEPRVAGVDEVTRRGSNSGPVRMRAMPGTDSEIPSHTAHNSVLLWHLSRGEDD